VTLHLKAIFAEGELAEAATCKDYLQVRQEGTREVSRNLLHYRLEAILAVGFRVRSRRGTQFRQWATAHLEEYLRKGFVMDDERLKNPPGPGVPDYFDELLERIREIRASEKRMYLQVRNILALAADYTSTDAEAQVFFQTVQNKLHYAATEFAKGDPKNYIPNDAIARIADTFKTWREVEKYSRIVPRDEIAKNDFNISPSRYIHTGAGEEYRPLAEIIEEIDALEEEAKETDKALRTVLGRIMA
jgi:hypothetical protein